MTASMADSCRIRRRRTRDFPPVQPNETVDFAVVGSGAAGAVLARELSQSGFTVLVFEQGPRFSPADFEHDELKYFFLSGITVDPKISPQTFRKNADAAAR